LTPASPCGVTTIRGRPPGSRCTSRRGTAFTATTFEAQLEVRDSACFWTLRDIMDVNEARIVALLDDGLSIREIADETGIPRSTVARIKKELAARQGVREEDD
jgi:uncharacterized protein YerC